MAVVISADEHTAGFLSARMANLESDPSASSGIWPVLAVLPKVAAAHPGYPGSDFEMNFLTVSVQVCVCDSKGE